MKQIPKIALGLNGILPETYINFAPFKWKFWAYTQLVVIMKSIEPRFVHIWASPHSKYLLTKYTSDMKKGRSFLLLLRAIV